MATLHHVDAGVVWFHGLGFRPAIWTAPHRRDEVDPPRLVPAPDADVAYAAKYNGPVEIASGYEAWPGALPAVAPLTAAGLASDLPGHGTPFASGPLIPGPWFPPVDYPCRCITPDGPDMPPVAPVPLPASAGLLLAAVAALFIMRTIQ